MKLTFLGTGSMVPTKERNVSAVFLDIAGEGILFDCGEGTQRQMNLAGIKRTRVTRVLLTHWHGDHVGGLIGLIQTIGSEQEVPKLIVYGPTGTKVRLSHLMKAILFDNRVALEIVELKPWGVKKFFENNDFSLECVAVKHRVPCLAYSVIEKNKRNVDMKYLKKLGVPAGPHLQLLAAGKSIVYKSKKILVSKATSLKKGRKLTYVVDTMYCKAAVDIAKNSTLVICEATHDASLQETAIRYKHMTSVDAATVAKNAKAKKLVMTHFSQRYKDTSLLLKEAKKVFKNTVVAEDFMVVEV